MEFQLSYFKSWNVVLWKCCIQYVSKLGKLSSGHRTGKGQLSVQSQRGAMSKNVQTTIQLCLFHMLKMLFSKSFKLDSSSKWNENFQMNKLGLEKSKEADIKLTTHIGSGKAREFQKNTYFCFIDYVKVFDYMDHNKLWKILKEMGVPDHLICLLRSL